MPRAPHIPVDQHIGMTNSQDATRPPPKFPSADRAARRKVLGIFRGHPGHAIVQPKCPKPSQNVQEKPHCPFETSGTFAVMSSVRHYAPRSSALGLFITRLRNTEAHLNTYAGNRSEELQRYQFIRESGCEALNRIRGIKERIFWFFYLIRYVFFPGVGIL
ncbi:hypothetical protein KM043_010696 [Ampulex compressa]|nr:hypothetical protein KM043_010696 [Ampulex compressa]